MASRFDYLGYPYDDTYPAFIIIPREVNTLDEGGGLKLVLHRPTGRMYDQESLDAKMAADGYTPPAYEYDRADDWLRERTGLHVPYEFTLSLRTASSSYRANYLSLTVSGGPATRRQKVTLDPMLIDETPLPYPASATSVSEIWIEVGDTADMVATKLIKLGTASWDRAASSSPVGKTGVHIALNKSTGYINVAGSGSIPAAPEGLQYPKPFSAITKGPYFRGVNMAPDAGMPLAPQSAGVRSEWVDDTHTAVRFVTYGFPVGLTRNVTLTSSNYAFGTIQGFFTEYTIPPGSGNDYVLNAITGAFPSSPKTGFTAEMPKTGFGAVFRVKEDASGIYQKFNYLPQWYLN